MEKILKAKEFLKFSETFEKDYTTISINDCEERMIEFARLHVEAALEAAYNMALQEYLITDAGIGYFTNVYPLTLIK